MTMSQNYKHMAFYDEIVLTGCTSKYSDLNRSCTFLKQIFSLNYSCITVMEMTQGRCNSFTNCGDKDMRELTQCTVRAICIYLFIVCSTARLWLPHSQLMHSMTT